MRFPGASDEQKSNYKGWQAPKCLQHFCDSIRNVPDRDHKHRDRKREGGINEILQPGRFVTTDL